jgi:hypothetical protein
VVDQSEHGQTRDVDRGSEQVEVGVDLADAAVTFGDRYEIIFIVILKSKV